MSNNKWYNLKCLFLNITYMNGSGEMFYAKYDAMDVAEYVLWFCETMRNRPISNLRLQKILYYIQGSYLSDFDEPIFDNKIEAWTYGPVVPDVYYSYNSFVGNKITGVVSDGSLFDSSEIYLIQEVIDAKINIPVWDLVEDTHNEMPWRMNYQEGKKVVIPTLDIKDFFDNN
ncbi:Panacea domain-containing protein [Paraclostridium sordellii]|uniref:Panacea domain-containing protein n=1 Tax=Paraclostridium sordellii TaxID=1505 RepID=UPI0030CB612E